jgi:DNA-binding CsgD family transcriptional regulator
VFTVPAPLIGRERELADIAVHLNSDALPAVVLVEGEAGIGKTSMCTLVIEAAREQGFTTLVTRPIAAEADLTFAGLGDLLEPVLDHVLDAVPDPQARALRVALLLEESAEPTDARALGVAFISALRALAEAHPLLVVVDDVQWLDPSSAAVLAYAGRRLRDDRVALLLARRVMHTDGVTGLLDDVWRLELGGLSSRALHRLLRERLEVVLSRPVLRRVHEISGGNPFYALEIARALELQVPRTSLSRTLPVPRSLGELLEARVAIFPPETQQALLVAASLSEPRLTSVSSALGIEAGLALQPAIEADIVTVDRERVRFTHPLFAAVTYARVDDESRRAVHRRLAGLVEDEEGKARHLALSTEGPDEVVARALENAAAVALARGASAAVAELSEQALSLTPLERESDVRRRTIATALHRFRAGDATAALALLEQGLPSMPPGADRAYALALLQRVYRYEGDQLRAAELGREALTEPTADDQGRAEAAVELASTLFFLRENLEEALSAATIAADLSAHDETRGLHARATAQKGVIEALVGHPDALATLRAAEELEATAHPASVINSPRFDEGFVMLWFDDAAEAARVMHTFHGEALECGDDGSIPLILANLAVAEYLAGRWAQAEQAADDGYEAAMQTGQRPQQAYSLSVRALVRASLGREDEARVDALDALTLAGERAMGAARIHSTWALGLLELSLDRPTATVDLLAPLREQLLRGGVAEPGSMRFVPDEIEALVVLGRLDEAEAILRWLEERGRALDRASALAAAARCRGLVAAARGDQPVAIRRFEQALAWEERARIPFDHARTLLLLGVSRRRAKQKAAAREALGQARTLFEGLGAALWAEKARAELARIGGRTASPDVLTPAEQRVAELVAAGRTNKEVASALFLTDRTVEGHLTSIYRKLGIRSRVELARTF